jgi:multidrug efflux system membrane fusion protein
VNRSRILMKILCSTALFALALLLGGCSTGKVQSAAPAGRPPVPVVVSTAEQRDIPLQILAIGNVEAYQSVQIRSMVNGQIAGVHFQEGQDVRKGDLLFTLDKRPFQATLDQAIGNLKRDEAQLANSELQARRYTDLEKQGIVSREQGEQQRTQQQSYGSSVEADKAAVDWARVQLSYTDIRSPIDSRTGAVLIHLGNLVKANDTPYLVQLNQIQPIYVSFTVPERRLDEVRRFAAGHLKVQAYPKGQTSNAAEGVLSFIDNGVDPQTGTVKLKATFQNKDRKLWPGEFVDVVLDLSMQKNAVVVPTRAIQTGQQGDYIFVVKKDSTAEARPVVTNGVYQSLTLVSKGVAPGETVIVDGQVRVVPNGKVTVQSNAPANTTNAAAPVAVGSGQ